LRGRLRRRDRKRVCREDIWRVCTDFTPPFSPHPAPIPLQEIINQGSTTSHNIDDIPPYPAPLPPLPDLPTQDEYEMFV